MFMRAAASLPEKARGVRVVDHGESVILLRQLDDALQVGNNAVHGEASVRRDKAKARAAGFAQLCLQISHVVVLVTEALCFAEPDAVNNAGVVELIADDRIFGADQSFEEPAVGIKTRGIEDRLFGAQELGQRGFELFMNVLCATDKAHARHPEPVGL
jgi:hypothetical protein